MAGNFDDHGRDVSFRAVVVARLPKTTAPTDLAPIFAAIEAARETEIRRVDPSIQFIGHERLARPGYHLNPNEMTLRLFVETTVAARFSRNGDDDWLFALADIDADAIRGVIGANPVWSWPTRGDETETERQARR